MENLAKALNKCMKEIKGLEKDMQVGNASYGYKGIADYEVKKLYKDVFEKNGLMVIPTSVVAKTQIDRWQEENTYQGNTTIKQKQSVFTEVETKYLLLHTSGESIEMAGYGQGVDTQDKGAGKATTYALKYALLYLGLTPTGKIDDTDNTHSDDVVKKPEQVKSKPQQQAKAPEQKAQASAKKKLSATAYKSALSSEKVDVLTKALTTYDLTPEQLKGISGRIAVLNKKK